MEVGIETSMPTDSISSASPDISSEIQRENGDGDEQGWPLPVVAARVDCPDGAVDQSADAPLTSVDNKPPSSAEIAQLPPQRKLRPVRTLKFYFYPPAILSKNCSKSSVTAGGQW